MAWPKGQPRNGKKETPEETVSKIAEEIGETMKEVPVQKAKADHPFLHYMSVEKFEKLMKGIEDFLSHAEVGRSCTFTVTKEKEKEKE